MIIHDEIVRHGLSPLARGTPNVWREFGDISRFIPAGAGNTRSLRLYRPSASVYPRWRGEHLTFPRGISYAHGLSPLARGTPTASAVATMILRFIPAGAGNTAAFGDRTPINAGLSPLARGTHLAERQDLHAIRFIPAGAGNTANRWCRAHPEAVYPRWRGEHTKDILLFYNSFLSTQQFTNFIPTISHY